MRKYKVGDVIKFKDLSGVTEGFTRRYAGISPSELRIISGTVAVICEIEDVHLFRVEGCKYLFYEMDIESSSSITPEQKNHILQLIREI